MNSQFIRSYFLLGSMLWGVIFPLSNALAASESGSLVSLVREYLQTESTQSSQGMFQSILNHPDANLQTIEAAIRQVPQFEKTTVGAQPRRSVMVKGKKASYALYVPSSYSPNKSYPLILCLHGAGFTGESYLERWVSRLEDRYILACPTISMGAWWTRFGEELTLKILNSVSAEYHVDPGRVFLTGMSNGGIGAWIIGMHHADQFAGIAPMASGLDNVLFPFLANLRNTPVYVLHGVEDQVMPVRLSRDLVQEMKRRGIPHLYREHQWTHPHAGGHFFPRQELPALIAWFDQQQRTVLPKKLSLVRDATHFTPLNWARIDTTDHIAAFSENLIDKRDKFIAGRIYAKLDAEITGSNTVEVKAVRVRRYTLFFNNELFDFSQQIVVKTNGVKSFEGIVKPTIETMLQESRRRADIHLLFPAQQTINVAPSE